MTEGKVRLTVDRADYGGATIKGAFTINLCELGQADKSEITNLVNSLSNRKVSAMEAWYRIPSNTGYLFKLEFSGSGNDKDMKMIFNERELCSNHIPRQVLPFLYMVMRTPLPKLRGLDFYKYRLPDPWQS
jgi:hypothetical protein